LSNFRVQQQSNRRKTFLLLGVMGSLTAFVIYAFALYLGYTSVGIIPIAIGISVIGVWGSFYNSDKIVLSMTGAKVIDHDMAPQLFNLVHEITIASGLPMPKVAIVEDDAPNAFATGRDPEHAVIAFTTGILRVMDREQLQGVAAHELAHVANRDTLVSAVAATTAGAIALMSDFLLRISLFGGGRRDSNGGANPFVLGCRACCRAFGSNRSSATEGSNFSKA
jgi:heat shock protein HtpX